MGANSVIKLFLKCIFSHEFVSEISDMGTFMSSTGVIVTWCLNLHFLCGAYCLIFEVCIQVSKFLDMILSLESVAEKWLLASKGACSDFIIAQLLC